MTDIRGLLAEHPFCLGLTDAVLDALVANTTLVHYQTGQHVAREGAWADRTILVRSGVVALEIHDPAHGAVTVQTIGPGDAMGWSWMLDPHRWHFDATALRDTECLVIDGEALGPACEADHELGFALAVRFLGVCAQRIERLRMQLLDVYQR